MEFDVEFGGEVQDLTLVLAGSADLAGLRRLDDQLRADPRFKPGLAILADITELDVSRLSTADTDAVVTPVAERDWEVPPLAVAIVAGDTRTFEQAELYRAHLGGSKSRRKVFSTRADAIEWLRSKKIAAY